MTRQRRKRKYRRNSERVIRVHGVRHDPPDTKRLSHALLALAGELAAAQAEADAQATSDTTEDAATDRRSTDIRAAEDVS